MTDLRSDISRAVAVYKSRHGIAGWRPRAALIDMDGVLYDSMPRHAAAWRRMMLEAGVDVPEEEFFLYEGMTGEATINLLFARHLGREASAQEVKELYARKSRYFKAFGERVPMPGAAAMLSELMNAGLRRVLVTGSAQGSLLDSLNHDYPGAFDASGRVTAHDVTHGKPSPEPYLKGLEIAGRAPEEAMVIENAPLGVQAGHAAGCFTVAVATGPIPESELLRSGADIVFHSMPEFASHLHTLLTHG